MIYLKHLDEDLGLHHSQIARLLGVSVHTVHSWSVGRSKPTAGARRLIQILWFLSSELPELHAAFVEEAKR